MRPLFFDTLFWAEVNQVCNEQLGQPQSYFLRIATLQEITPWVVCRKKAVVLFPKGKRIKSAAVSAASRAYINYSLHILLLTFIICRGS